MSKSRRRGRAGSANTKRKAVDDYEVGYGRPPRQHQFMPGHSGNPKGSPKGAKNEQTIVEEIMNRRIEIRENGRVRKVRVLAAILLKFTENALKGDPKAATFLLNRYGLAEDSSAQNEGLDQNDQEILDAFAKTLETRLKAGKRKS